MSSRFTQFSIMLVCCISVASFAIAGEVHAGLKNAIDAGNFSLAKNLVEKVGVTDIYCPAKLNANDAEKIYAQILQKDSLRIVYCIEHKDNYGCDVSRDFEMSYLEFSCNAKQEKYSSICKKLYSHLSNTNAGDPLEWDKEIDRLVLQWLHEKKGICLSKENINNCKLFFDNTYDPSLKMEILRILDQKKLLDFKYTKAIEKVEKSCEKKKKKESRHK